MLEVAYTPKFIRAYKKLVPELQIEVKEAISLLQDQSKHSHIRVHKLHGRLADRYSFSVNYRTRVVFQFLSEGRVLLLMIGDHSVYG